MKKILILSILTMLPTVNVNAVQKKEFNLKQKIVNTAKQQLGKPYEWAGAGPQSFDCSGLLYFIFKKHGIRIPRQSYDQLNAKPAKSLKNIKPSDIIGYNQGSHVGIYIGANTIIHAPKRGENVKKAPLNQMSISKIVSYL